MSECVVRMEMPSYCGYCKLKIWDRWLDGGNYRCVKTMCKITGHMKNGTKPNDCPIICSLPEGHGRLVDADSMEKEVCGGCVHGEHKYANCIDCALANAPTIVPAERSET